MEQPQPIEFYKQDPRVYLEWFNGYIWGNAATPLSSLGYEITVRRAVLERPPHDWSSFTQSLLTYSQTRTLGHILSVVHHALGIQAADIVHRRPEDKLIDDSTIQGQWTDARKEALLGFSSLMSQIPISNFRRAEAKELQEYFSDSERLDQARDASMYAEYVLLRDPEVRELTLERKKKIYHEGHEGNTGSIHIRALILSKMSQAGFKREEYQWLLKSL